MTGLNSVSKDDVMRVGKYIDKPLEHPETINKRRSELEKFMSASHEVTLVILRVLSEQLGLDPDLLPNIHKLDRPSGDQARVTFAPPVDPEVITLGEHSGTNSLLLYNRT